MEPIVVIGAGLAGCEAAWQIARRGGKVTLYEMKPEVYSLAHSSPFFAELVCSNSLKSQSIENASGVLKEEMGLMGSLILKVAKEARVPAGDSLAVDREVFSKQITQALENLENVEVIRKEVSSLPRDRITIVATRSSHLRKFEQGNSEGDGVPSPFFLRCHLTHRDCGFDQLSERLQVLQVWERGRRLCQLPDG